MPGTKRKRGGDSWRLEVTIGTDYRGKPRRFSKTVHCKSEAAADRELARFYVECESGSVMRASDFTVSAMCADVLEQLTPTLKKNTVKGYQVCLRRIDASIGPRKAAKVLPKHLQEWVNDMAASGTGPKTIRNTYSFLRMCYEKMIEWDVLAKTPCQYVRLPKMQKSEPPYLEKEDLIRFIAALDTLPDDKQDCKVAWMLAFMCGLRRAEICGLDEEDVDLEKRELHIRRTRNVETGGLYVDTPKSLSSTRSVAFPEALATEIRRLLIYHKKQRLKCGALWEGSPALIKSAAGGSMHPNYPGSYLAKFCKRNNLPHTHMHALRHTHASLMKWMGYDVLDVSAQLGHSQKSTTLNIYSHLFENAMDRSHRMADNLDDQLSAGFDPDHLREAK